MKTMYQRVAACWHHDVLNEEARDVLRAAQDELDLGELSHKAILRVLGDVARRLPSHSLELAADRGDGAHALYRIRAGTLEPPVALFACDSKNRPLAAPPEGLYDIDFGDAVPDGVLDAIHAVEHATGCLIDHEATPDGLLLLSAEFPDEPGLERVLDVIAHHAPHVRPQLEQLWIVDDGTGPMQCTARFIDGRALVEPVSLLGRYASDDDAAALRWTYERAARIPPARPQAAELVAVELPERLARRLDRSGHPSDRVQSAFRSAAVELREMQGVDEVREACPSDWDAQDSTEVILSIAASARQRLEEEAERIGCSPDLLVQAACALGAPDLRVPTLA
jgi:hypothetical protein